jgi:hypothetical protein
LTRTFSNDIAVYSLPLQQSSLATETGEHGREIQVGSRCQAYNVSSWGNCCYESSAEHPNSRWLTRPRFCDSVICSGRARVVRQDSRHVEPISGRQTNTVSMKEIEWARLTMHGREPSARMVAERRGTLKQGNCDLLSECENRYKTVGRHRFERLSSLPERSSQSLRLTVLREMLVYS